MELDNLVPNFLINQVAGFAEALKSSKLGILDRVAALYKMYG